MYVLAKILTLKLNEHHFYNTRKLVSHVNYRVNFLFTCMFMNNLSSEINTQCGPMLIMTTQHFNNQLDIATVGAFFTLKTNDESIII